MFMEFDHYPANESRLKRPLSARTLQMTESLIQHAKSWQSLQTHFLEDLISH